MKKKTTKNNKEKVFLWGMLNNGGNFVVTVSSVTAWLYSENPILANKFIKKTNGIYSKIESEQKEIKRKELKAIKEIEMINKPEGMVEFEKRLKMATGKIYGKTKRKWYKFW